MKRKLGRPNLCIHKIMSLEKLPQWHKIAYDTKYNIWRGTIMPCKWTTPCESPTMVKFNILFYPAHCIQIFWKHSWIDIPIVGSPLHMKTIVLMNIVYFVILAQHKVGTMSTSQPHGATHVIEVMWMKAVQTWANHIQVIHSHIPIQYFKNLLGQPVKKFMTNEKLANENSMFAI
jgi:hypothetical protein